MLYKGRLYVYPMISCDHSHDSLFSILETVGKEVNRLHICDGVLLYRGLGRLKRADFRFVRETILYRDNRKNPLLTPAT